jgi:DNA mismatch repair ATPase MutS
VAVLGRWVGRLDWARNALFAPIAYLLLWRPHVALGIERWRRRHGAAVRRWLEALGEMEALGCLAGYAREHPADPFPALVVGPAFDAEGLGHPLMSAARCVRNDVRLDAGRRVLVVSGSNMSGKSTLLRSVGLAAVIALAGGPVRARRLSLSPLSVGATLRIRDSLRDGRSRFYAEVLRLRAIQEASRGPRPVLFLLDELLHGTNSRDRRIGGEALVRRLVESGAVGLLTTHDLALADLAETIPAVEVAHFEDEVRNGRPVFDFRLRPGVVDRSNAIELMRAAGLDV